jgi:colicin import membrane protein
MPRPNTSVYDEAMRIIAALGAPAETQARLQELRDARAEIDAAHAAATQAIKDADAAREAANAAIAEARREQGNLDLRRQAIERKESDQRMVGESQERAARNLEARETAHREAVAVAVKAHDERQTELNALARQLDERDAETERLKDEAQALRDDAARLKADIERRAAAAVKALTE